MNEFKSPPSFSSAPLCLPASAGEIKEDVSVKWVSEGMLTQFPIYYYIISFKLQI